jgi:hypothetical protein
MSLGIDLQQQAMQQDFYRQQQLQNAAYQRELYANKWQPGLYLGMAVAPQQQSYTALSKPTKEQVYKEGVEALRKQTSAIVDMSFGITLVVACVLAGAVKVFGGFWTAVGALSIVGGVGLYLGIHKAVFAYRKRKYDLAQATKAMME